MSDGSDVHSVTSTRSRRRASTTRGLYEKIMSLQQQVDEVSTKLDLAIEKEAKNKSAGDNDIEADGHIVVDRNELMKRLSNAQSDIDKSDK